MRPPKGIQSLPSADIIPGRCARKRTRFNVRYWWLGVVELVDYGSIPPCASVAHRSIPMGKRLRL